MIYLQSRVDNRVPGTRGTWIEASDHCPLGIYSFSRSAKPAHDLLGSLDQQMEPHSLPLQMFPFDSPFPILVFTPNKTHPDSSRINTESRMFVLFTLSVAGIPQHRFLITVLSIDCELLCNFIPLRIYLGKQRLDTKLFYVLSVLLLPSIIESAILRVSHAFLRIACILRNFLPSSSL